MIEKVFEIMPQLKGSELKVLIWIVMRKREDGIFAVDYSRMEKETGLSIAAIIAALKTLVEKGYIEKLGKGAYRLTLP